MKLKNWTERTILDMFLPISKKSIRVRWGLTFSITEHCFGHQIVNLNPIVLSFGGYASF